jgi:hypothetical protein
MVTLSHENTNWKFRYFSCKWSENEEASSNPEPRADGNSWSELNKLHLHHLRSSKLTDNPGIKININNPQEPIKIS